jgi:hypothetical protein
MMPGDWTAQLQPAQQNPYAINNMLYFALLSTSSFFLFYA